jgi:hypothetical protein
VVPVRARERQRLEWGRKAAGYVYNARVALAVGHRGSSNHLLRAALRIITIHGPSPLRPQAKELLGRLG